MTVAASRSGLTFAALALALMLVYTGISAGDKLTWLMEVTPVIIIVPLLLATRSRYPLTPLLYTLIFFHAIILMVGGMYTYAKVPIGFDVQAWLGLSRNPYDKLGHFFQGWCRRWRRGRFCCAAATFTGAKCSISWSAVLRWRLAPSMN